MEQAMAKSKISPKEQIQVCNYQSIHLRVFWVQYGRRCQFHTQTVSSFVRSQQLVVDLHSAMYEQNCNSTNDLDLRLLKVEKQNIIFLPNGGDTWWFTMVGSVIEQQTKDEEVGETNDFLASTPWFSVFQLVVFRGAIYILILDLRIFWVRRHQSQIWMFWIL